MSCGTSIPWNTLEKTLLKTLSKYARVHVNWWGSKEGFLFKEVKKESELKKAVLIKQPFFPGGM